ncbi:MAG: hypothetical protein O7H39_05630, partial [Gammaproteobacteria bacterium]|nr:hypothetical protein [Gammaproteobacteria bacterium]
MPNRWAHAICKKELHQLQPLIFALFVLELLVLVEAFGFGSPDEVSWAEFSILFNTADAQFVAATQIVLALIAAYMLMPREQDDRTVAFLWALPLPRLRLVTLKWLTALGVMIAFCVVDHLISAWLASFDANSVTSDQFRWSLWWIELAMISCVTIIGLGYGMLISFFRLAGLLAAVLLWLVTAILESFDPTLAYLNPQNLLTVEHHGTELVLAWDTWWFHGIAAAGSLALALRLWSTRGDDYDDWRRRFLASTVGRIAMAIGVIAGVVLIAIVAVSLAEDQRGYPRALPRTVLDTGHYSFHFAGADAEQVEALSLEADAIYANVRDLLDAGHTGRIVADLTDTSPQHLGVAGWKKVRIKRSVLGDPALRAHVLAHETTHVFAATESRRRLASQGHAAGFFSEGIAEWTSYRTLSAYPSLANTQHALRLLAAAAWLRFDLEFHDLVNRASLAARYDDALIYALGEAWVTALADTCGERAPGDVLRAIGRIDAPQRIGGRPFWEDSLQAAGCGVERVNAQFSLMMQALEEATHVVPRVTGGAKVSDDTLTFTIALTAPVTEMQGLRPTAHALADRSLFEVILRVRDSADVPDAAIITRFALASVQAPATLTIPRTAVGGERYQFQFGVTFLPDERPFFERWQSGTL